MEDSLTFRRLDERDLPAAAELFHRVFTQEPWQDDWSDADQLRLYLHDLTGQSNSLTFGLFAGGALVGLSMGHVRHWYSGTEYCIDELCIRTECQGQGLGARFVREIEAACRGMGLKCLFLLTEDDVPAYAFYKKLGFTESEHNVAFSKRL